MKSTLVAPVVLFLFVTAGLARAEDANLKTGLDVITPAKLKLHLSFIASDELGGRGTPSPGQNIAARYMATYMETYGYKPMGDDGTFFQKLNILKRKASRESSIEFQVGEMKERMQFGTDFYGMGADSEGGLAFAGYGLVSDDGSYDDYKDLDVKGKLVVVFDGLPAGFDRTKFRRTRRGKANAAAQRGAKGLAVIMDSRYSQPRGDQPSLFQTFVASQEREREVFEFRLGGATATGFQVNLAAAAGEKLGKLLDVDLAEARNQIAESKQPHSKPLEGSFRSAFKYTVTETNTTQNVVAYLEGSDPELKNEIVAFSAHIDHLGTRQSRSGQVDPIYNGADDDGSGTVGILTLGEAFSKVTRPKRSLMFIWHTAEERGLIGSDYFVRNPPIPLDRFVTLINIDMIGRNYRDKEENSDHVFLVGADKTSSDLRATVLDVCRDRMRLDENDSRNYFRRSDHFHYARNKIPVAFFCTGEHKDYHRPSDEVHTIMFDKMKTILDIAFETGLRIANQPQRPKFTGGNL